MSRRILTTKFISGLFFFLIIFTGSHAQPAEAIGKSKAYPNPFRESITVEYHLQQGGKVEIWINNILGQQIRSLVKEEQQVGWQRVRWDGMDESGSVVGTGIYYITLQTRSEKSVIKVMKTK
jgi:flagellar hook assembly protein FlgD